jgi:methylmalonyl-CoA mutase N-terminal domain/subunit
MAAALGGTQSLHTNSYDEALGLPTDASAKLALRTQQILAFESGVGDTVDPLAGSYYIESLTDELEAVAMDLIAEIDEFGGAVAAIEAGFQSLQIEDAAYRHALAVDSGAATIVGVNRFVEAEDGPIAVLSIDPALEKNQARALAAIRTGRNQQTLDRALATVAATARSDGNLLYPMKEALRAMATVGEVSKTLETVFGRYQG